MKMEDLKVGLILKLKHRQEQDGSEYRSLINIGCQYAFVASQNSREKYELKFSRDWKDFSKPNSEEGSYSDFWIVGYYDLFEATKEFVFEEKNSRLDAVE